MMQPLLFGPSEGTRPQRERLARMASADSDVRAFAQWCDTCLRQLGGGERRVELVELVFAVDDSGEGFCADHLEQRLGIAA